MVGARPPAKPAGGSLVSPDDGGADHDGAHTSASQGKMRTLFSSTAEEYRIQHIAIHSYEWHDPRVLLLVSCSLFLSTIACSLSTSRVMLSLQRKSSRSGSVPSTHDSPVVHALNRSHDGMCSKLLKNEQIQHGAVGTLVNLLKSPSLEMVEQAMWVLGKLAQDGQDGTTARDAVLQAGVLG